MNLDMINNKTIRRNLIERHHAEGLSLLVYTAAGEILTFHHRGVADLYQLYTTTPASLANAFVVDKVVGKGAAAIMAVAGIDAVYADVISKPALALLRGAGIDADCKETPDNIINRARTGICPVEALCANVASPSDCIPLIKEFLDSKK